MIKTPDGLVEGDAYRGVMDSLSSKGRTIEAGGATGTRM